MLILKNIFSVKMQHFVFLYRRQTFILYSVAGVFNYIYFVFLVVVKFFLYSLKVFGD